MIVILSSLTNDVQVLPERNDDYDVAFKNIDQYTSLPSRDEPRRVTKRDSGWVYYIISLLILIDIAIII